jgi:hypothetical protein
MPVGDFFESALRSPSSPSGTGCEPYIFSEQLLKWVYLDMATRKEAMMSAVKNGIDQANAQELMDVRLLS